MRTPVQIVKLHYPMRWATYSLPGGLWGVMLGVIELRWRWPMAAAMFVKEPQWKDRDRR